MWQQPRRWNLFPQDRALPGVTRIAAMPALSPLYGPTRLQAGSTAGNTLRRSTSVAKNISPMAPPAARRMGPGES